MMTNKMTQISEVIVRQSNLIAQTLQFLVVQGKLLDSLADSNQKIREAYNVHMQEIQLIRERLHESREAADNGSAE